MYYFYSSMALVSLDHTTTKYFKLAQGLALFTIFYNLAEGALATFFGYNEESLSLFGFGADSFIETISGFGIYHMIGRIRAKPDSNRDNFEKRALRVTGLSFYILVFILIITSIYKIITHEEPTTTVSGIIISLISILIMYVLVHWKTKAGKALNSDAILADAECTKICIYMSVVLLISSAIYQLFKLPYTDSIGALVLAYLSYKEGKECFEKANSEKHCSCEDTNR